MCDEIKISLALKWLQWMIYLGIVSVVNSIVNIVPDLPSFVNTWISRGIMVAMIFCTYKLSDINAHYRKSTTYRAVMLGCTLAAVYLFKSSVLNFAGSICSVIAVYQEYRGHAELVEEKNPKFAGKWHSLFYWGFVAGILISLGSVIATLLIVGMKMDIQDTMPWIIAILGIPQIFIEVIYLRYLQKTIQIIRNSEIKCDDL